MEWNELMTFFEQDIKKVPNLPANVYKLSNRIMNID